MASVRVLQEAFVHADTQPPQLPLFPLTGKFLPIPSLLSYLQLEPLAQPRHYFPKSAFPHFPDQMIPSDKDTTILYFSGATLLATYTLMLISLLIYFAKS